MREQLWWYVARASGTVAWAFLTASVSWGILLSTDLFARHRRPAWLLDLHRWLGALTVWFAAVHVAALVADTYIHFGLADVTVPLVSDWKPLPVALGVVAAWGIVAVQITSLTMRRLPRRLWRAVHLTSYGAFWLATMHGTLAGSDAARPLYAATSILAVALVLFAVTYRVLNGRRRRPDVARRGATATSARADAVTAPGSRAGASP